MSDKLGDQPDTGSGGARSRLEVEAQPSASPARIHACAQRADASRFAARATRVNASQCALENAVTRSSPGDAACVGGHRTSRQGTRRRSAAAVTPPVRAARTSIASSEASPPACAATNRPRALTGCMQHASSRTEGWREGIIEHDHLRTSDKHVREPSHADVGEAYLLPRGPSAMGVCADACADSRCLAEDCADSQLLAQSSLLRSSADSR